jgi:hypothetical protein
MKRMWLACSVLFITGIVAIGHAVMSAEKARGVAKALKGFKAADPALAAYGFASDMGACYDNPNE